MNKYILYTLDGTCEAPDGFPIDNCQYLGEISADDESSAINRFINANPWFTEHEYARENVIVRRLHVENAVKSHLFVAHTVYFKGDVVHSGRMPVTSVEEADEIANQIYSELRQVYNKSSHGIAISLCEQVYLPLTKIETTKHLKTYCDCI